MVAEVNQGGELVEAILRQVDRDVPFKAVRATRGKWVRAEPVAALYAQGRVSHVGRFADLEDEMCDLAADGRANGHSPDRVDALVWALTELMLSDAPPPRLQGAVTSVMAAAKRAVRIDASFDAPRCSPICGRRPSRPDPPCTLTSPIEEIPMPTLFDTIAQLLRSPAGHAGRNEAQRHRPAGRAAMARPTGVESARLRRHLPAKASCRIRSSTARCG